MKFYGLVLLLFSMLSVSSCVEVNNAFSSLPPGIWRATLDLDDTPFAGSEDEVIVKSTTDDILPFLFELKYDENDDFYIEIINGKERIKATDIKYGRDLATAKDTVIINFPVYDSYIRAIYEENLMEGRWYVNNRNNYSIPFKAYFGQNHLFSTDKEEKTHDLSGRWEVTFGIEGDDPYPAVGEFTQEGNQVLGTFMTETGDYRFLAGQVIADKFGLSVFDGAHAFLFNGKFTSEDEFIGTFRAGKHHIESFSAKRNSEAVLKSPYDLTTYTSSRPLDISFPDTEGNLVSLEDDLYKGKIKLVVIMGTWCPNCRDQTVFLNDYIRDNETDDIEVLYLAFEKHKAKEKAVAAIQRYKDKMNTPWNILLAGSSDKAEASKILPMLSNILSYPTLLFVDEENRVKKIHTGFNGPATSKYADFVKVFNNTIAKLRSERDNS